MLRKEAGSYGFAPSGVTAQLGQAVMFLLLRRRKLLAPEASRAAVPNESRPDKPSCYAYRSDPKDPLQIRSIRVRSSVLDT
jgi:hypothetical protein